MRDVFIAGGRPDLVEAGRQPNGLYEVTFEDDAEGAAALMNVLRREEITWSERVAHVYADDEVWKFPVVVIRPPVAGSGGPQWGNTYDFHDACTSCGTGARPRPPLIVEGKSFPRAAPLLETEDGELLIDPALVDRLASRYGAQLSIIDVRTSEGVDLSWKALVDLPRLPHLSSASVGLERERPCELCSRDGYFFSANDAILLHADITAADAPPIAFTAEHFGNSVLRDPLEASSFAAPMLAVRPDVYCEIREDGGDIGAYEPIVGVASWL